MNKIITIVTIIIIYILGIMFIIIPKNSNFSEEENRYLQTTPTFTTTKLLNGSYTLDLENYIEDNFPLRKYFIQTVSITERLINKDEVNSVIIGKNNLLFEKYNQPNIKKINNLIKTINNFSIEKNVDLILVPSSISINYDKKPVNLVNNELIDIEYIYNKLSNINYYNLNNYLINLNKSEELYYHLDHHYNSNGAYYVYKFYQENAFSKDKFNIKEVNNNFIGTMASKSNIYNYPKDKILVYDYNNNLTINYINENKTSNSLYYYDNLNKKDKYLFFLNGNFPIITIKNDDIKSKEKLLIIKDSYANSFIPFLTNHYQEIHIIDPRMYAGNITNYIKENNINKTLIFYNMNNFVTDDSVYNIK